MFHRARESTEEAFARTASLAGTGCWEGALEAFAVLDHRLRRRIRSAEEYVFPLFEIKAGSASELTRTLVLGHREIENGLQRLGACLRQRALDDVPGCVRALRQVLEEHDGRAGRLFYPLLDRLLTHDERRVLMARGDDEDEPGTASG
ncbi:MAG TPA: hypothetical protein VI589_08475 [Vicinamibacteria bacterium]